MVLGLTGLVESSFLHLLESFSRAAIKFRQTYKKIPVLIVDNANKIPDGEQGLLDHLQDFAKTASDEGIATVVFVSSEGQVPRHMAGKFTLFLVLFVSRYVLIKYYRKKLVV
jgi:hypothetical protein